MLTSSYPFLTPTEISDDFGAFWRYLEQAPEMTIEIDYQSILVSTCPSLPEAIRKLNCYFYQILSLERSIRKEARLLSTDKNTSVSHRFSLTPVDQQHKPSVDRHHPPDIDRHSISDIDRY
ncbi:hypothetical protein DY000_02022251 [Brassica cretica]|uniref:Uncharacterized protein n=1 Tax=Brassica cretica TaxID=69181 RepID=A0ABQ7EJ39_BRACR|nr:hypothetical protein DY000_02022251 [Brassica cretica]